MLNRSSIIFLVVVAVGFSIGIIAAIYSLNDHSVVDSAPTKTVKSSKPEPTNNQESQETPLPTKFVLKVPFYVQAPFAVWDELHGEACEEASLHMVRDYYRKTTLDLEGQDQQILNFIHWQQDNGYKVDLTLSQLASAAKKYYQFGGAEILENPTIDEIKREVLAGRPVIVPAAGRLLDNPNFRTPGPIYHMLVIKGFDKTGFITNDPGTRNGEGFHYSYQNLYQSIHNWDPIEITNGAKAVLVYQR